MLTYRKLCNCVQPSLDGVSDHFKRIAAFRLCNLRTMIEVTPDQISTSHRLPTRRTRHENNSTKTFLPPIIVKFVNRDARNKIYANRKLTRDLDCNNFSVYGTKSVFINENLTRPRKKLLWMTKQKAQLADYKYLWTSNGNIFVRKSEETDALAVKTNDDLRLIV